MLLVAPCMALSLTGPSSISAGKDRSQRIQARLRRALRCLELGDHIGKLSEGLCSLPALGTVEVSHVGSTAQLLPVLCLKWALLAQTQPGCFPHEWFP